MINLKLPKLIECFYTLSILTFLVTGCQKHETNTKLEQGEKVVPQSELPTGFLEIDANEEDFNKIFLDLNTKLSGALYRIQHESNETKNDSSATRAFDEKTNLFLQKFLNARDSLGDSPLEALRANKVKFWYAERTCPTDLINKNKIASVNTQGITTICISKTRFENLKMSTIEYSVLSLALNELAQLFGFDKNFGLEVQEFSFKYSSFLWPSEETANNIIQTSLTLVRKALELREIIEVSNDLATACSITEQILGMSRSVFKSKNDDIKLFQNKLSQLSYVNFSLDNWNKYCSEQDFKGFKRSVVWEFQNFFDSAYRLHHSISNFYKPLSPFNSISDVELLKILTYLESDKQLEESGTKPRLRKVFSMQDLGCKVAAFDTSKTKTLLHEKIFTAQPEQTINGIGQTSLPLNDDESETLILKRLPGQKGFGATFQGTDWLVKHYVGMIPVSGNLIQNTLLAILPDEGGQNNFQFEAISKENKGKFYEISCAGGDWLNDDQLNYKPKSKDFNIENFIVPFSVGYTSKTLNY